MAGNARFHDKLHRTNHHTLSTAGIPDSATDPIASPSNPFQGDFVVNGLLSSSKGLDVLSANYGGDVYCENIYVRDTTYTDFISGMGSETIISDGALTGFGDNTLTLDYGNAIYAKVNNKTAMYVASSNVGIGTATPHPYGGKIFHIYNDNIDTSSYVYDPRGYWTSPSSTSVYVHSLSNTAAIRLKSPSYGALQFIDNGTPETYLGAIGMSCTSKELAFSTGGTLSSGYHTRMIITSAGNIGIGTTTPNERLIIDGNIGFVNTSGHYIKSPYGSDNAFLVFGGTNTGANSYLIHPFYSLSSFNFPIYADYSLDTILPYQEKKVVYGSEQVTRYFLISGIPTIPIAVAGDANVCGLRGFAYSGNNKFNAYGLGGNASVDIRTAGVQSLSNCGGYIIFSTMPMNSGTSIGTLERMRITHDGKVGIGTTNPTGLTTPFSAAGKSVHLYNNTNDDTSTNSNSIFIAESVNRNSYFQAAIGPSNIGGLSVNRSSDASTLGRILIDYTGSTVFQNGNDGFTETMRIISEGNVGIGTSAPIEKLHVVGNVLITGNLSALGDTTQINTTIVSTSAMIIDTAGTTDALRITQRGTGNAILVEDDTNPDATPFVVTSGGNVGIGTNTPISKLHVDGSITIPNGSWLNLDTNNGGGYTAIRRNAVVNGMEFSTSSASRMVISDSGNIGIGTTSPTNTLHISGGLTISNNPSSFSYFIYDHNIKGPSLQMTGISGAYIDLASTNAPGGAGSLNDYTIRIGTYGVNNFLPAYNFINSNQKHFILATSDIARMSILTGGNVGIGIIDPTEKLHVSGNTLITENLSALSGIYTSNGNSNNWNSVYSTVSSTSANLASTYSIVSGNSAKWNSTYSSVSSTSASWLSGNSTLSFVASTMIVDHLTAGNLHLTKALLLSLSSVTVAPGATVIMTTDSPSYFFATVSAVGTTNFNLPPTNGNNIGMTFYIKNTSLQNTEIISIRNSAGTPISFGNTLNGNGNEYTQVVWDGTTWQTIFHN